MSFVCLLVGWLVGWLVCSTQINFHASGFQIHKREMILQPDPDIREQNLDCLIVIPFVVVVLENTLRDLTLGSNGGREVSTNKPDAS